MGVDGVQLLDLLQREPQGLEALDEGQPLELVLAVDAAPGGPAAHPGQQPELLPVADGAGGQARAALTSEMGSARLPSVCQLTSTG